MSIFSVPTSIFSSRFVPSVSISSEFAQEEEVSSDGDEPGFAPDLKLFVGNLPFTVDSAQLASLFEMVKDRIFPFKKTMLFGIRYWRLITAWIFLKPNQSNREAGSFSQLDKASSRFLVSKH